MYLLKQHADITCALGNCWLSGKLPMTDPDNNWTVIHTQGESPAFFPVRRASMELTFKFFYNIFELNAVCGEVYRFGKTKTHVNNLKFSCNTWYK